MNYGFTESILDGTENIIDNMNEYKSLDLPSSYSYEKYLGKVKDQGNNPTCVPHAISTIIEWKNNINNINKELSINWLFEQRKNKDISGMSIKEALNILKHYGYVTTKGYKENSYNNDGEKIKFYGKLISYIYMQKSLLLNGPFIIALPVYNSNRLDFWNGSTLEGGHALTCIGYNESGLILRNSWGYDWGDNGNTILPYNSCGKIIEAWAII